MNKKINNKKTITDNAIHTEVSLLDIKGGGSIYTNRKGIQPLEGYISPKQKLINELKELRTAALMAAGGKLAPSEALFVERYFKNSCKGYLAVLDIHNNTISKAQAVSQAYKFLKRPAIRRAIQNKIDELQIINDVTLTKQTKLLQSLYKKAGKIEEKLKIIQEINKMFGIYAPTKVQRESVSLNLATKDLLPDERARVNGILDKIRTIRVKSNKTARVFKQEL